MSILISIITGFASGVFLRSLFVFNWAPVVFVLLLATLLSFAAFLKPRFAYGLGAVFCICLALGVGRATLADVPPPQTFVNQVRQHVTYEGIVVSDPDLRDGTQRVHIRVSHNEETTRLLAVVPRTTSLSVGDRVRVSGVLLVPQPFVGDTGRTFLYDKYLQRDGVRFIINFAFVDVLEHAPWYSVPAALARAKHAFLEGLSVALPEPYSALAGGVVIGGKTGLGYELQDAFVRSGLVQIIVLSGYNVMVVAELLLAAFARMSFSKRASVMAGAIAIVIFVGIAGLSATAVRAALMALIALYARATGHTYAASRALLFVALLMLIWNPLYLVFDPGFGFSVVATAGLIWLAPIIERYLSFIKSSFWKNAVATTLAAQVSVLPLLLYEMGLFSVVAIPANLLVMPIVPLAMAFSAIAGFAGMLFGSFAPLLGIVAGIPSYLATSYIIWIAETSSTLPFAAFTLPLFPFWLVLLAYATLVFIASSKRFSTTDQLRLAKNASI